MASSEVNGTYNMTSAWNYVVLFLMTAPTCQSVEDCRNIFLGDKTSGAITSLNYPFDYESPTSCRYVFLPTSSNETVRICFDFRRFDLVTGRCDQDYLEFPSGYRYCEHGRLRADQQNSAVPSSVWKDNFCWQATDPGKPLSLTFNSRSGYVSSGFFAFYKHWPYTELGHPSRCKQLSEHQNGIELGCAIQCSDGSECDLDTDPDCGCPDVAPCHPEQFTCFNRKCLASNLTCDKTDNCGDGSDETYMHARCQSRDLLSIHLISCDFKFDVCGFLGLSSWKRDSTYRFGPTKDHTVGTGGYYLRTDFAHQKPGTKISFFSQILRSFSADGLCLSFWYYAVDDNRGKTSASGEGDDLLVVRFGKTIVWSTDTPTNRWHSADVFIAHEEHLRKFETKLVVEVTRGHGYITVVALDDIVLHKGPCFQILEPSCTFEQHSCGWSQEFDDDLELNDQLWHLCSNESIGHGRFLCLSVSSSPSSEDYNRFSLYSPYVTQILDTYYCIRIRLYTSNDNTVVELRQDTWPDSKQTVWSNEHKPWRGWQHLIVTVSASDLFRVVLVISLAQPGHIIAIDDVSILTGQCYNYNETFIGQNSTSTSATVSQPIELTPYPCSPNERLCPIAKVCLDVDRWCDGQNDCSSGEDEHTDYCRGHETVSLRSPSNSARHSMSVSTIFLITSVGILLAIVSISLVFFCVVVMAKQHHVRCMTSSIGRRSLPPTNHVTAAKREVVFPERAPRRSRKYQPGNVSRSTGERWEGNASSVDSNPVDLTDQSRYLDPPPSYSSAIVCGGVYPEGEMPIAGLPRLSDVMESDVTTV